METKLINGDSIEEMKKLPTNSVDLISADPPYFKVINEKWDFQWRTEDDYIKWTMEWITEAHRVLRIGGSFYLFGYFNMLARLVPEILKQTTFDVRQQIIIDKGLRAVSGRATKKYKMFPRTTESTVFFIKDNISFLRNILREKQKETGLKSKEINERLGMKSNGGGMWSIYTGDNICEQFPTRETFAKLTGIFDLKLPYDKYAVTFNPIMGLSDVWTDIDFYSEDRIHPTQKPIPLMERIINASSNEGDVVMDPFLGSGSTGVACKNLNRNFIGIELDKDYFEIAKKRINQWKV